MSYRQRIIYPKLPATFAALRYPNFRRWFFGQTVSMMGTWMQSVAQSWLVYEMTGSQFMLGIITFIGTAPTLFFMLPAGAIADRVSRRRLLLVTQTAMMLTATTMALLSGTHTLQVWHIAVLAGCLGIATSFDAPTRQALVVEMVEDRKDLQNAIALNSMIFNMARVVGPAVGGIILAAFGATWCFAFNGLSFLAVLIALWGMRLPEASKEKRKEKMTDQIIVGLRYVRGHAAIRSIIILVALASLFAMSYTVLLPAFASDVLGVGEAGLGGLNAAIGVGALIGSLAVASLGYGHRKGLELSLGSLLMPAALLCFSFSRNFSLSLIALAFTGFGLVMQNATGNTVIQGLVRDDLRGRVMSLYTLTLFGTAPFGSLLIGAVAQHFGSAVAVGLFAAITLVAATVIFTAVPAVRRQEL